MNCSLSRLVAALLTAAAGSALAAPIISPYAAGLAASAYSADAAAGGSSAQSVFIGGYWNAGSHGSHWVQADMGSVFTLSQVRFAVDVMPANVTLQQIYLSNSPISKLWSGLAPVASRSGYTIKYQQFEVDFTSPASGRYLQVVSDGGGSWTALGDEFARSNRVDPVAQGGLVPEPASLALSLVALAGLLWRRRAAAVAAAVAVVMAG